MFEWGYLTSAVNDGQPTVYRLRGVEVARLSQKVDGTWHAILDQHRIAEPRTYRDCTTLETGKRGVEMWAERHRERLEADVARIEAHRPYRTWMPAGQKDGPKG